MDAEDLCLIPAVDKPFPANKNWIALSPANPIKIEATIQVTTFIFELEIRMYDITKKGPQIIEVSKANFCFTPKAKLTNRIISITKIRLKKRLSKRVLIRWVEKSAKPMYSPTNLHSFFGQ